MVSFDLLQTLTRIVLAQRSRSERWAQNPQRVASRTNHLPTNLMRSRARVNCEIESRYHFVCLKMYCG